MRQHPAHSDIVAGIVALTMTAFGAAPAHAQQKSISLVVAGSVGSSYNIYGRTLARHIRRYLPGDPNIIVRNMHGAGGNIAAEYMHAQAPSDGSMFFLLPAGSLIDPLFSPSRFKYDPNKFEYVGTMDQDTRVCLTAGRSPVKTFADARAQSVIIAGTQAGSTTVDYPNFLNALAGTKFKLVQGYRGTDDVMLAMERGEADGMCTLPVDGRIAAAALARLQRGERVRADRHQPASVRRHLQDPVDLRFRRSRREAGDRADRDPAGVRRGAGAAGRHAACGRDDVPHGLHGDHERPGVPEGSRQDEPRHQSARRRGRRRPGAEDVHGAARLGRAHGEGAEAEPLEAQSAWSTDELIRRSSSARPYPSRPPVGPRAEIPPAAREHIPP